MNVLKLHDWTISPAEAIKLQRQLRSRLELTDRFERIRTIAGADVALDTAENIGIAGAIVYSFPDLVELERQHARLQLNFPYVPGLLAFREAPVLLAALRKLRHEPDLLIFDGQGIAHPRRLGIASHMGLLLDKPTIGCAKSRLIGTYRLQELGDEPGSTVPLMDGQEQVGVVLRTRRGVKPVFASQGHRVSLQTTVQVLLRCCDGYRIPRPTRQADKFVAELKRTATGEDHQPSLF